MSMHQHDLDLIMALADETLDGESAAAARAEIAGCAECSLDLEMQTTALAALHDLPEAALTEFESARIRRDVKQQLGIFKEEVRFEPSKKRRRFPVAAFGTAAAVLIAVVAVAPRLSLVGGSGDADTVGLPAASPTTAAATFDAFGGQENVQSLSEAPAATTTTVVPEATSAPSSGEDLLGYYEESPDLGQLRTRIAASEYDETFAREFVLKDADGAIEEEDANGVNSCLIVALNSSDEFVAGFQIARGVFDEREAIFYVYLGEDLSESAVVVQAADTCEELARAGP